jgi:Flp pilus assembly protein TadG
LTLLLEDNTMPAPALPTMLASKAIRRFRGDRKGSAAVQFAFIAPLFFALMFAIIESSMVFFAGQILETGTADSARLFMTHQAQDSKMTQADFKKNLCDRVTVLFSCDKLYVDVKAYAPNTAVDIKSPIVGGKFVNDFSYDSSKGGDTVVVRAFYQWPLFVTGLGFNIADIDRGMTNSKKLLAATAAFRVEPD